MNNYTDHIKSAIEFNELNNSQKLSKDEKLSNICNDIISNRLKKYDTYNKISLSINGNNINIHGMCDKEIFNRLSKITEIFQYEPLTQLTLVQLSNIIADEIIKYENQ